MRPVCLGRYEVLRLLGEGGFGEVFLARDPLLEREVAIKVPRGSWWGAETVLAEARALARLQHPCIVQVMDAGLEGERAFIVLEYVSGPSLEAMLEPARGRAPTFSPEAMIALLEGPAAALDHALSQGILHRDLKPANILLPARATLARVASGQWEEGTAPKIVDLGLAELVARHGPTEASAAAGDPRYVAAEAWRGAPDPSSEIFSLAAVAFHVLAGRSPLAGDSPMDLIAAVAQPERLPLREIRPDLSASLEAVFKRALSGRRGDRPSSAREFLGDVRDSLRKGSGEEKELALARLRMGARRRPQSRACPVCRRPMSPRATHCLHCGPG